MNLDLSASQTHTLVILRIDHQKLSLMSFQERLMSSNNKVICYLVNTSIIELTLQSLSGPLTEMDKEAGERMGHNFLTKEVAVT